MPASTSMPCRARSTFPTCGFTAGARNAAKIRACRNRTGGTTTHQASHEDVDRHRKSTDQCRMDIFSLVAFGHHITCSIGKPCETTPGSAIVRWHRRQTLAAAPCRSHWRSRIRRRDNARPAAPRVAKTRFCAHVFRTRLQIRRFRAYRPATQVAPALWGPPVIFCPPLPTSISTLSAGPDCFSP